MLVETTTSGSTIRLVNRKMGKINERVERQRRCAEVESELANRPTGEKGEWVERQNLRQS